MVHYALTWSVALSVIQNVSYLPSFRFYLRWSLSLSILKNKSHLQQQTKVCIESCLTVHLPHEIK